MDQEQMMARAEYVRKLVEVHGAEQTTDILALSRLTGKEVADVVKAFYDSKAEVNHAYYGV